MRFGKFALVGTLGAAMQLVVFALLVRFFHLPGVAAAPVAVEIVVLHNFCWHERFTWRDRILRHRAARLCRFHVTNGAVSLAGNTALIYLLVHRFGSPPLPAAVAAIALCAPANFALADRWVYRGEL